MSKYTVELRNICKMLIGHEDTTENLINAARPLLFDFDTPFGDYAPVVETSWLYRYYMREIGFETYGLFKHYLHADMLENWDYYKAVFEECNREVDKLCSIDKTVSRTTDTGDTKSENTSNSISGKGQTNTWNLELDTPQGKVSNMYGNGSDDPARWDDQPGKYLSGVTRSLYNSKNGLSDESKQTTLNSNNSVSDYVNEHFSTNGDYITALNNLINKYTTVNRVYINNTENLFMSIY